MRHSTSASVHMAEPRSPPRRDTADALAKLAPAIFVPAKPFDSDEEVPQGVEYLKEVIANLEAHNDKVRFNLAALVFSRDQSLDDKLDSLLQSNPQPESEDEKQARIAAMVASIEVPYKSANGSPAVPKLPSFTTETTRVLEEYNQNAEKSVGIYRQALSRRASSGVSNDGELRRLSRTAPNGGEDVIMGGTDEMQPPAAQSVTYDRSRDPRLKR